VSSLPTTLEYPVPATTLPLQEERFVAEYAISGDRVAAYLTAFPGTPTRVRAKAGALLARPFIQARLREHQEAITKIPATKSAARMIHELEEICEADPNELIRVVVTPCLGCWPASIPEDGPNDDCPACKGRGETKTILADTSKVSPGARRLYKGVELYPDGSVKKLLVHDQMQARYELHRLKGMHVERSLSVSAHMNVPQMAEVVATPEDVEKFLDSLK
jgi:hypothetical protein